MTTDSNSIVRTFFKSGTVLFVGLAGDLVISFLAKLLIARTLTRAEFGAIAIGITVVSILSTVSLFGIGEGIGRHLPRFDDQARIRGTILSGLYVSGPITLVLSLGVVVFAPTIAGIVFNEPDIAPVLRVFGLVVPLATTIRFANGVIQGRKETLPKVLIENVSLPTTRFVGAAVAVLLGFRALGFAWVYFVSYLVSAAMGAYYVLSRTPLVSRRTDAVPMVGALLSFSAPLVVSAAMAMLINDIDTIILAYFTTTADVGVYNVVYSIGRLLIVGVTVFHFVFMPILSELHGDDRRSEMERFYQVVTKWIFIGTLPVFLVVALFPTMTVTITFGAKYRAGAPALSILAVGFFVHALMGLNSDTLIAIGRTRVIMVVNAVAALANVVLNLVLIPRFGLLGAAVATAVSYLAMNILFSFQLYRTTGIIPFSQALLRPGAVAITTAGIAYVAITTFFRITTPVLVVGMILYLITYVAIVLLFGGIEEEEIMLVTSFEERFDVDLARVKILAERLM